MIEVVKENPCTECGIKGLYENCKDECVQYRKWYQYQQGRADAIDELFNKKVFNNNTESLFDLSLKECTNHFDDGWDRCYHDFEEIAEQLKEQTE